MRYLSDVSISFPRLRSRLLKASPDELYISEDVCASIIYESKQAVGRCKEVTLIVMFQVLVLLICC